MNLRSKQMPALLSVLSRIRSLSLFVVLLSSFGCRCSSDTTQSANPASCKNSCERNDWPRLIVGLLPTQSKVGVVMRTSNGAFPATEGGCPTEFDSQRMFCSFSYSAAAAETKVSLEVSVDGVALPPQEVTLEAFNHCARNIAYVELALEGTSPTWSAARYINPCESVP
jgi:hypothetical protein